MANKQDSRSIQSPLQLFGSYLFYTDSTLAAGLFATSGVDHWTRYFMMFSMALGVLVWVGTAGYMIVHLTRNAPHFLFNPSSYDPKVQPRLFSDERHLFIANPPAGLPSDLASSDERKKG